MSKSTPDSTFAHSVLRWVITIIWIVLGIALSFMCTRVFGNTTASIGVPVLVVVGALIWYFTERRDRNKPEENV